jgi:hypothetical protein
MKILVYDVISIDQKTLMEYDAKQASLEEVLGIL